ncbi:MAG: T9SS type A sorting domain-containing protein [Bacteroidota bacterium]
MKTLFGLFALVILLGTATFAQNINFDAANIITGDLGSYSSNSTNNPGYQLKAAYPAVPTGSMISSWYGDSDLRIVSNVGTYGGINYGKALKMEKNNRYIEFGPFSSGGFSFVMLGSGDASRSMVRVYNSGSIRVQTGNDQYFSVGSSHSSYSYCSVSQSIPQGGFVRIYMQDDSYDEHSDDFYIDNISSTGGPMPVELTSFRSYVKDNQVELQWTTATELNNFGFEVERSANGEDWTNLGFVAGNGTSYSPRQYAFRDAQLDRSSTEFSYRLKQIDRDGTTEYSSILHVTLAAGASINLTAYPQPFASSLNIDLSSSSSEQVTVTLYNSAMQKVASLYEGAVDGRVSMNVPTSDLRDGSYFLIVNHANGQTQVQKVLHMQSR